jgi:hypothetical protein
MAQIEDFVIDNGTGAAVRADINRALMAIATTNTGTTTPLNPVFGMLWVDTTTATLKIYVGDDKWLIITDSIKSTTVSGSMTFPVGTKLIFNQASPPPGWELEDSTSYAGAALRVVTGTGGGVGGGNKDFAVWMEDHTHEITSATSGVSGGIGSGAGSFISGGSFSSYPKYTDVIVATKS